MLGKTGIKFVFFVMFSLTVFFNAAEGAEIPKPDCRYPDYVYEYLGNDKFEKFNRRMFNFNSGLNKYAIRPVHILWASIMPKYGMDRIKGVAANIEYPARLVSSLIQKDFEASKNETLRFLANTTIGLGGMYDPAKSLFKIPPSNESMEQAFAKCKIKPGPYLVVPVLNGSSVRGLAGRAFDAALNPSCYIATPVLAIVKAGLLVNRTSYMQPVIKMIESNFADPYDISRKFYGVENYIKCKNYDRKDILDTAIELMENQDAVEKIRIDDNPELVNDTTGSEIQQAPEHNPAEREVSAENGIADGEKLSITDIVNAGDRADEVVLNSYEDESSKLMADELLFDYNPQNPVTDSMRTALFDLPGVDESIWAEISVWNRCFAKRIKTASVNVSDGRDDYKFRYILQKKRKESPLAVIFPSIGEGIMSSHSVLLAKLFYDAGYSVVILGSAFQWEFAKSMPEGYHPGIPAEDADYLKITTKKIIDFLENKYEYNFSERVVIGTSFGALTALFLAEKEYKNNTLGITKYIAVCPPVELIYAMRQVDKIADDWSKNPDNLKDRVAVTASKIIQLTAQKDENKDFKINRLPFTEYEAKLITGFIMHQKLSDLVYTLEKENIPDKKDLYLQINNTSFEDYAKKYLLDGNFAGIEDLEYVTSLHSISDYLKNGSNYIIFHSVNDYLTTPPQLKKLKLYTKEKSTYLDNGAHLGFMYREEFLNRLKEEIALEGLSESSRLSENSTPQSGLLRRRQKLHPTYSSTRQFREEETAP